MMMDEATAYYLELNAAWTEGIEAAMVQADAGLAMPIEEVFSRVRSKFWKSNFH